MNEDNGTYIKLFRKITEWEWYTDLPVKTLFIHILLRASATGRKFRGQTIPAGAFTTSVSLLATETGLSVKQVRTALNKLKSTGEITTQGANKYTQIFIVKWGDYQSFISSEGKQRASEMANKGQTEGKQRATIKECKDSKDSKNIKKEIYKEKKCEEKHKHGEYKNVLLTDEEYNKLYQDYPNAKELITYLDEYIEMKGYTAKSHYLAIKKWVVDAVAKESKKKTPETYNPFLKMLEEENGKTRNP